MIEGKSEIIKALLSEYAIQSVQDIQAALKDLLGGTIKKMMEVEMEAHLGYEKSWRSDNDDYRNGYKSKHIKSRIGEVELEALQDRKSSFEPQVIKKSQKDISDIAHKIISMYAKGMITRQISDTIEDMYSFDVSEGFISDVIGKILVQLEERQNRPLDDVCPVISIDAIHYFSQRQRSDCQKAAYVILGLICDGRNEALSLAIGENESAKFRMNALNELKNRGVQDVMIISAVWFTWSATR